MSLKLIKTDTLTNCRKCKGTNFVHMKYGWACNQCFTFVWEELANDIRDKRGI